MAMVTIAASSAESDWMFIPTTTIVGIACMGQPVDVSAVLRRLPKVDEVLGTEPIRSLLDRAPRWAVREAVRGEIERLRALLREGRDLDPSVDPAAVERQVKVLLEPSLVRVLNATGVVLHTNLGRAPLAEAALERVREVCGGYANLEYDLDERRRGSRHDHVRGLLAELTGAEDALVVNNCAGAVLLALAALAQGREAVVSRGELVEIGGSFRVPDVMRASGVRLVEVGTTNRTHPRDYENAAGESTALFLKVHRSNFAVTGFTAEVSWAELAALATARGLLSMVDLGSGALIDLRAAGLDSGNEPSLAEVVRAGVDLVACSGDKLLGGPQAGLLVGRREVIARCRSHPLMRALRPSRLTLAALEATLELYRDDRAREVPALAMLLAPEATLEARARALGTACAAATSRCTFEVVRVRSAVGGGALPECEPWSWAVAVSARGLSAADLDGVLRRARPPVVGRIADEKLLLDVRTLGDRDLPHVASSFITMGEEPISC
jgi:L-seryl-tRNA(Ser) seleniumtransferase